MLEAGNAIQGLLLHSSDAGDGVGVAGTAAEARRFGQRKSCEFNGPCEILHVALVVEGQLLACVDGVESIVGHLGSQFMPQPRGGVVVAPTLGKECQLAARLRAKFGRKAEVKRLRAGSVGTVGIATTL